MTHVHAAAVRNISIAAEDKFNSERLTAGNIPGSFYDIGTGSKREYFIYFIPGVSVWFPVCFLL